MKDKHVLDGGYAIQLLVILQNKFYPNDLNLWYGKPHKYMTVVALWYKDTFCVKDSQSHFAVWFKFQNLGKVLLVSGQSVQKWSQY